MKAKPHHKETETAPTTPDEATCARRHLRLGWWSLLAFLSLGIVLEGLHGLKSGWYLDVANETRRLMWTLAHAHGTLLALVHIAFAFTVTVFPGWPSRVRTLASRSLIVAGFVIPLGFFLGGIFVHAGDPNVAIILVPIGAAFLFAAIWLTAKAARS